MRITKTNFSVAEILSGRDTVGRGRPPHRLDGDAKSVGRSVGRSWSRPDLALRPILVVIIIIVARQMASFPGVDPPSIGTTFIGLACRLLLHYYIMTSLHNDITHDTGPYVRLVLVLDSASSSFEHASRHHRDL